MPSNKPMVARVRRPKKAAARKEQGGRNGVAYLVREDVIVTRLLPPKRAKRR